MPLFNRRLLMSIFIIVLLTPILNAPSQPATAQDTDTEWFYITDYDQFSFLSYSLDGETNILHDNANVLVPIPYFIFPDSSALMSLRDFSAGIEFFIAATPSGFVSLDFDIALEWTPLLQTERFGVLTNGEFITRGLLYDSVTHTFEYVATEDFDAVEALRFSADGKYLRYALYESANIHRFKSIVELNLETGEERVIFSLDRETTRAYLIPTPDEFGDRWLWAWDDPENEIRQMGIIHTNGTMDVLSDGLSPSNTQYSMQDHQLLETPLDCATACTITLHRTTGDPIIVQTQFLEVDTIDIIDDNSLLASRAGHYWLLTTDAEPQYLGFVPQNPRTLNSPQPTALNNEWLVALERENDPHAILIWDLASRQIAAPYEHLGGENIEVASILYRPNGIVISTYSPDTALWFDPATEMLRRLPYPDTEYRNYYELLPDGTLLVMAGPQPGPNTAVSNEVWRYNPITGDRHLILERSWWGPMNFPTLDQRVTDTP